MASRSLTPFGGEHFPFPFSNMQREMNRLFEDFMPARAGFFNPDIDVKETDKEICVNVDLPGVSEKDVDVSLEDDMLIIRGEKQDERKEERGSYRYAERSFGSFQRALRLPVRIDPEKIRASFDHGVLKVVVPKDEAATRGKRIEVKTGNGDTPNPAIDA